VLCQLGVLRWLTLLSFNLAYVVVPLLLFERTRSLFIVGVAMFAEGLLRATLALWVGAWARRLRARRGMVIACVLRLAALALLAVSVARFSVVLVALASTLFYVGHFFATLEQELRSATLGARAVAAQTVHRIAEVLAPPVAFAVAIAARTLEHDYAVLLATGTLAVFAHGAGFFAWFTDVPAPAKVAPGLAASWRHLRAAPALARGLVASIVGFTFYGWALLATPFALTGRRLLGLALDSAPGIALFKTVAAIVGVGGAVLFGRWLRTPGGERGVVAAAAIAPLAFALALTIADDAAAVMLLALVCAMLLGLFTWQRRLRQVLTPSQHFHGVTAWCMAIECVHVSLIGLALIAQRPWVFGIVGSAALVLLLVPTGRADRS
jgi:hypothetical protein